MPRSSGAFTAAADVGCRHELVRARRRAAAPRDVRRVLAGDRRAAHRVHPDPREVGDVERRREGGRRERARDERRSQDAFLHGRVSAVRGASVVVCGHTHLQFDRTIGPTRVVNAGSVGLPLGTQDACWLLLGPGVDLRRTRYDVPRAADLMRATGYPNVEEFFVSMLLQPPSEARALEMYASAELT